MLPFIFEQGFGFERWVDYILDVPMYFIYRDGNYLDVSGLSFRDYLNGELAGFEGQLPTMADWTDHMTTAFPEVRLKHYIEMRGTDGGPWGRLCALPALWVGLLYDQSALDAAWDLCRDWTDEEREYLRTEVPRLGLKTPFRGGTLQAITQEVLKIARSGLANRDRRDRLDRDESLFIDILDEIASSGITPAEELLDAYENDWQGNIDKVYETYSY